MAENLKLPHFAKLLMAGCMKREKKSVSTNRKPNGFSAIGPTIQQDRIDADHTVKVSTIGPSLSVAVDNCFAD